MSIINPERRDEWERLLCQYFNSQKAWIVGHWQEYLDDGLSERAATRQTRRDFFDLVVDELADRADDALTWDRVKRDDVRKALEALDGFVFRAMFRGALRGATARLMGKSAGFALLLDAAHETIEAVQAVHAQPEDPSEAHTVIQSAPDRPTPRLDALAAQDAVVPDFSVEIPDVNPSISSGQEVRGRLAAMLANDRIALRQPPEYLPDDDDTDSGEDEEEEEVEPESVGLPAKPSRLFGTLGLGGVFKSLRGGGAE